MKLIEEPVKVSKKNKGTIAGAVSLIVGTTIGSGVLALPLKTSPAGLIQSSISLTLCWAFLLIEALLLIEINVRLLRKKSMSLKKDDDDLEIISIRTMAQETLGEWGGVLATVTYVFFGYASMVAYTSKSGEILYHLTNVPESISGIFFTALFTILIFVGGTRTTDQVNQWLTTSMVGLLVVIEILATEFGDWLSRLQGEGGGGGDWGKVPAAIPVMIFSLVYHDLAPVLCAYLGGDVKRLRTSVLLGSIVPLATILVWNAIALDLSQQVDQVVDPVELLTRVSWDGVSYMVEAFSLLAVGTSMIGTLLGFSEFYKEQLNTMFSVSPETIKKRSESDYGLKKWWARKKTSFTATALVIAPSLLVSTTFPDAFSAATDIAGGYCMTMLYGVLPPAMAWAMLYKNVESNGEVTATGTRQILLLCVGLVASVILAGQFLQDVSTLHS